MSQNDFKHLPDEELIKMVARGDAGAFEELLRKYETPVITFCYGFMRSRDAAEDMAQETFLRIFRNADRYKPIAKFTTWLYKIAANLCINALKKKKTRQTYSLDDSPKFSQTGSRIINRVMVDGGETPLSAVERKEVQDLIRQAIDHLPDDQRTTLILVEYHHMQYQEVADIFGVTVSAIKMRVKRARETMRTTLNFLMAEKENG